MKKCLAFFLLPFFLSACRPDHVKTVRILLLSLPDPGRPLSRTAGPGDFYHLKVLNADLFQAHINDRENFLKRMKVLNGMNLDAFVPTPDYAYYNFKWVKRTLGAARFPCVISDENKIQYRKFFKSFILNNHIQFNVLLFCMTHRQGERSMHSSVPLRKNDLKVIFLHPEEEDLTGLGKVYNILIRRREEKEDFILKNRGPYIELDLHRTNNVCGELTVDYDIKNGLFTDAEFTSW